MSTEADRAFAASVKAHHDTPAMLAVRAAGRAHDEDVRAVRALLSGGTSPALDTARATRRATWQRYLNAIAAATQE